MSFSAGRKSGDNVPCLPVVCGRFPLEKEISRLAVSGYVPFSSFRLPSTPSDDRPALNRKRMTQEISSSADLEARTITRTLTAAGYEITNARRQPYGLEVQCSKRDLLGVAVQYVIAFWDADTPNTPMESQIRREALHQSRLLLSVARQPGPEWLGWAEFLDGLGGAVPTWRALTPEFPAILDQASRNEVPAGLTGEAWRIFEEAVADGLEFVLGRRVRRLGGARRASRVGDIIAMTADESVFVVDAKASGKPYDASWPNLRPLVEYVKVQQQRQRGHAAVGGAVLVARKFEQSNRRLAELSAEFLAETRTTLTFLETSTLAKTVAAVAGNPGVRNAVLWSKLLSRPGSLSPAQITQGIAAADAERYPRDRRPPRR